MPYVMLKFGVIVSLFILVGVYILCLCTLRLLLGARKILKLEDYYKISLTTYGNIGGWITKLCLLMNNLGVSTAYLIIYLNCCS